MKPPPRWTAAAVVALGAAVSLALNWPGHLSYDSVLQLAQGRAGVYNHWHPPVMAWLLGLGDAVLPGAALFAAFDTVLIAAALAGFALAGPRLSWPAVLLAAAMAATPQLLIYPAEVWKDVLFAAASVAGFAALVHLGAAWRTPWRRWSLLATAALLLTLAALARQNGAVAPLLGAAVAGWIAAASDGRRRGAIVAAAFAAVCAVLWAGATAALDTRSDGEPSAAYQVEDLQAYDIVGVLKLAPATPLPVLRARAPALEALLRKQGVAAYTPARIDPVSALPPLRDGLDDNGEVIARQWLDLIGRHPLLYLRARAAVFGWTVLTPDEGWCVVVYVGVDGPEPALRSLGMDSRSSARDDALEAYALRFFGTPVFSHLAYGALALGLLGWLLWRRAR